jgi:hypothetical protein
MEAGSVGKHEYGDRGRWVKYWVCLGCCISLCYGPFSLGTRFETYKQFIFFLIFKYFFRAVVNHRYLKPRILNQWIRGHTCIFKAYSTCSTHSMITAVHPSWRIFSYPFIHLFCTTLKSVMSSLRSHGYIRYVVDHIQFYQIMACLCRLNTCFGSICGQRAIARL